jgi:hypothetical protein
VKHKCKIGPGNWPKRKKEIKMKKTIKDFSCTDKILYFAYGSNLNEKQMMKRCPAARKLCSASLGGAELGFLGGLATIFPEQGFASLGVEGGLWLITP